ncbi:hypothetical protein [Cellulomonas persica]|uniref:EccD-like transmembrane domain-containing protein n=1 Tax=Cellulomonas persica TaxID=76861 RepID=A0A510UWC8_9CELL|nr:hypothetical protein [Cellulomonas persica]GEK18948.1 hypothetical protein CPE01_26810 [Cellulomonas persica]
MTASAAPATTASQAHVRLVVAVGTEQRHVALRRDVVLADALRAALVPLDVPGTLVLDSAGRPMDVRAAVGALVEDGAALHVVRPAPRPRGRREVDPEVLARRPRPQAGLLALAGALGAVLLLMAMAGPVADLPAAASTGTTSVLALLALVVAGTGRTGRGTAGVAAVVATLAAPVLAAAAGAWATLPETSEQRRLAVVVALVCATVVAGLRAVVTRALRAGDDEAVVVLGALVVAASVQSGTLLLDLPQQVGPALLVGLAPLVLRAAPRVALAIPDEQLVDVSQVARTAESVRSPRPRALGRVSARLVARTVDGAERRVTTAVALACATTVLLAPGVLAAPERGSVDRWGAVVLLVCVVLAFVLVPRASRGIAGRWLPRLAAGLVLLEAGLAVPPAWRVVAAVGALVLGALVAAVAAALARGWHSVVASRFADGIEGLAVVLALPASVVASGLVGVLRGMVG